MVYPDLAAPLHGEAEGGAAVPVLGGGHHEAVTGEVGADPAVGEPAAAHAVTEDHQRPPPLPRHLGTLQYRAEHAAVQKLPDVSAAKVHDGGDVGHLVNVEELPPGGPARPPGQHGLHELDEADQVVVV